MESNVCFLLKNNIGDCIKALANKIAILEFAIHTPQQIDTISGDILTVTRVLTIRRLRATQSPK